MILMIDLRPFCLFKVAQGVFDVNNLVMHGLFGALFISLRVFFDDFWLERV
jgi:hypothetical protein